jgi:RHS repeat-associated protein
LPFGDGLSCTGSITSPTEHHFTGKERDTESGNDYFEARYYSSNMGRFMSPDWSAQEEPVPYADLDDPQSLNLYAYVRNNPLDRTDPDGHCPWCAVGGALVAMGAELVADKMMGTPVTFRGMAGAAVGGAIIGGSMGLATGEDLAIGAAIAGTASVAGGIADRAIKTGSMDEATKNPGAILTDAVVGVTAHVGSAAIEELAGKATAAGRSAAKLEKKLESTQSPKRYNNLAKRLPGKEAAAEASVPGNAIHLGAHGAAETPPKVIEKKNKH